MLDSEFKKLINRARFVEYQVMTWYKANIDKKARLALPKTKEYDIICPKVGNVEVKEDQLAEKTNFFAFEMEDCEGKPSGIALTTAGEFALIDKVSMYIMKTTSLLFIIRDCKEKKMVQMGSMNREGRKGWGYLIPCEKIIYSPYVVKVKKWFK